MMQITFTTMRPNANVLFSGKHAPVFRGTCRLLMPAGLAEQLVRTVVDSLNKAAKSSGATAAPVQKQVFSGDKEDRSPVPIRVKGRQPARPKPESRPRRESPGLAAF
jgi:hypothetical protein